MKTIDARSVEDIARGSAVLASGGGGDPFRGLLATTELLREFGPATLAGIDELDPDTIASTPFLIGAPLALLEKFPIGRELAIPLRELARTSGVEIGTLFPGEIGGINSMFPLGIASMLGIPVLDADTMGRAYPEIDMTLLNLAGFPMSPLVVTDDYGLSVVLPETDAKNAERIGRLLSLEFGASVGAAAVTQPLHRLRAGLVAGSVSLSERLGVLLRNAHEDVDAVWEDVLRFCGGVQVFKGRIVGLRQDIVGAFGKGLITIQGEDDYRGDRMEITVINENLLARNSSGQVLVSAPDIITLVDSTSGQAITTENVRYGYRVKVVAMPCDDRWLTPEGLATGGPERFGFDCEYTPFEGRGVRPAETRVVEDIAA